MEALAARAVESVEEASARRGGYAKARPYCADASLTTKNRHFYLFLSQIVDIFAENLNLKLNRYEK